MANISGFRGVLTVISIVATLGLAGCSDSGSSSKPVPPADSDGDKGKGKNDGDKGKGKNDGDKGKGKQDEPGKVPPKQGEEPARPSTCDAGTSPDGNGIVNGKPIHPAFEVVSSIVRIYSVMSDGSASVCTGTLLDSESILTAAHCVNMMWDAKNILVHFHHDPACESEGFLNDDRDKSREPSMVNIRRASSFVIHRDYSQSYFLNDIALIKLSEPAPASARPVALTSWGLAPASLKSKVLAVGYGKIVDYEVNDDNHRLRYGWVKPLREGASRSNLVDHLKRQGLGERSPSFIEQNWLFFDQTDGNGVCAGDSGGPAFVKVNGRWSQVGIASFVARVSGGAYKQCSDVGVHVNLDAQREWVRDARARLNYGSGRLSF